MTQQASGPRPGAGREEDDQLNGPSRLVAAGRSLAAYLEHPCPIRGLDWVNGLWQGNVLTVWGWSLQGSLASSVLRSPG